MIARHRKLISKHQDFFRAFSQAVHEAIPDAESIWLHGSRADGTARRGSDWDFIVFVPTLAAERRMSLHEVGKGALAIMSRTLFQGYDVHIQAEETGSQSHFCQIAREEGFPI